jgi:hypothetical protein
MLHISRQTEVKSASLIHVVSSSKNQARGQSGRADGVGGVSARGAFELMLIASRRCSAFFAEAAVLVLVFGILDYFMLKGRIELEWIVGALAISVGLLGASIAMDFAAQRWAKGHP